MTYGSRLASMCAGAAVVLGSAAAFAAPVEFVEQRANYMIFEDVDGTFELTDWSNYDSALAGYGAVEDGFLAVHPDDSSRIVAYTTFDVPLAGVYRPLANDVHGIGYENLVEDLPGYAPLMPYFDDTPNSQVIGFVYMTYWAEYVGNDLLNERRIRLLMGQEFGHRWGGFVHFDDGAGESDVMLGRQKAHWSFYMHSGGSPIEGNDWTDNLDGTFTATKGESFKYSKLDLYLMGLLPAEDVEPWFVIENPSNCVDSTLPNMECAAPQSFLFPSRSYTVTGTRRDITIDDVIAVEGPRMPAYPDAPDTFDVSFVLIQRPGDVLAEDIKVAIEALVDRSIELWEEQTCGLGHIVNRSVPMADPGTGTDTDGSETGGTSNTTADETGDATSSGGSEGDSGGEAANDPSGGCGCRSGHPASWVALLGLAFVGRARRR